MVSLHARVNPRSIPYEKPATHWRLPLGAIEVPVALLFAKDLTPAAKFLWIRLRFDELDAQRKGGRIRSHAPTKLAKRTGLGRSTIYNALNQSESAGWLIPQHDPDTKKRRWKTACPLEGEFVRIPVNLIRSFYKLRPQSILCFGMLQTLPRFNDRAGAFKWEELSRLVGLHITTVKRAVRALVDALWIRIVQKNRVSPVRVFLQDADEAHMEDARAKLNKEPYFGEGVMRLLLSMITAGKECHDGAKPDFLVNPSSGEKMHLDRYYPLEKVAFEFNGPQHYEATERFNKQQVAAQRKRDATKRRLCKEQGVALVVVHAEDLSVAGMLQKVGDLLPRRMMRGLRKTIRYLNACGRRCQIAEEKRRARRR